MLRGLEDAIEDSAWRYALASSSEEEELASDIEDLLIMQEVISSQRYLTRPVERGDRHHNLDLLEAYIREYPDDEFLALFRMHRDSFWKLVELLKDAGGEGYWDRRAVHNGRGPRQIYQQVAVALYVLGGGGVTAEKSRMLLNIGNGTVWGYTWRVIELLARLTPQHVRWPTAEQRAESIPPASRFRRCIGFLDGSTIVLRYNPKINPESYLSRKNTYGLNLQAICDWRGSFIWVSMEHTARVDDSAAFESTELGRALNTNMNTPPNRTWYAANDEYILADNAYPLGPHVITPYKDCEANAAFNSEHTNARIQIKTTLGMLKARWPTLYDLPVRILEDVDRGLKRAVDWTMACVVLHNFLTNLGEDESWLEIKEELGNDDELEENDGELDDVANRRRDEIRSSVMALAGTA